MSGNLLWLVILIVISFATLYFFRGRVIAGVRATGGVTSHGSVKKYGWLVVSAIIVFVAFFMFTGSSASIRSLVVAAALALAVLTMNRILSKKGWFAPLLGMALLSFIAWSPTWQYVEKAANWWIGTTPAQTVEELEDRIPLIEDNEIIVTPNVPRTVHVSGPVFVTSRSCHYLDWLPKDAFTVTWPEDLSRFYIEQNDSRTKLTVTLKTSLDCKSTN